MPSRRTELLTALREEDIVAAIRSGETMSLEFWESPRVKTINSDDPDSETVRYTHAKKTERIYWHDAHLNQYGFVAFGAYKVYGGGGASHYDDDYWVDFAVRHQLEQPHQSKHDRWDTYVGSTEVKALKKEVQL